MVAENHGIANVDFSNGRTKTKVDPISKKVAVGVEDVVVEAVVVGIMVAVVTKVEQNANVVVVDKKVCLLLW